MKKNLIINFLYQASYQLLLIILPVITIPIISNALGPEGIGMYNYINSIVTYFVTFASLGIINYGTREISIVRSNRNLISKKFWEIESLSILVTLIVIIFYIFFTFLTDEPIYFLISGLTLIGNLFDITWFFQGIENFKKITVRNFIIRIISFVLIVTLIKDSSDFLLYIFINSMSNLVSQLSLWISLPKFVDFIKVELRDVFSHLKSSLAYFVAKISMTAYQNATQIILGVMTNMSDLGLYSNSYTIILMSANIINAMNTVLIPRMSNMFGSKDEEGMVSLLIQSIHTQLYITIAIMFGIIAISNNLVGWFFGPDFYEIRNILPWLAPVVVTQSFQMAIASQYLIPRNEIKSYNLSIIFGAILTIILTIVFIPFFGIYGAVIGINIGYLSVSLIRLFILYRNTTFRLNYSEICKYLISGLCMLVIINLLTSGLPSHLLTTIFQISIGVIVYLILSFVFKMGPVFGHFTIK